MLFGQSLYQPIYSHNWKREYLDRPKWINWVLLHSFLPPLCNSSPMSSKWSITLPRQWLIFLFLIPKHKEVDKWSEKWQLMLTIQWVFFVSPWDNVRPMGSRTYNPAEPIIMGKGNIWLSVWVTESDGKLSHYYFHPLVPMSMYSFYWGHTR